MTSNARLTYYNGFFWRATVLPGGTRTVQLLRRGDNGLMVARAEISYPIKPTRA
jgi:hypothetical protein